MTCKNSYHIVVGPADNAGEILVSGSELAAEVYRAIELAMMDYVPLPAGWTGEIIIRPVTTADLGQLRHGYETWKASGAFPKGLSESN
jgi:hypothetical protein